MEDVKPMTVADLIVILSEMDPTLEIVTPQAPYGGPTPVYHGFVSVISVDSDELAGEYCGVGFTEEDCDRYCETDDLEPLDDEEEEEFRWHDSFVPATAEDVRDILSEIDDEYDEEEGYDDDGGEED